MGSHLIVLLSAVGACWLLGLAVLWRARAFNCVSIDQPLSLAVIIPARNEAHNMPVLLPTLMNQSARPAEIVVVDDHSTDDTADAARKFGARVVSSSPLPDGWRGKTWACHQGAVATKADHLLFLDADTRLEPEGLAKIIGAYSTLVPSSGLRGEGERRPTGSGCALSVAPYQDVRRWHEQLSAIFNLVMTAGIGAFTVWPREPDGLFGPMLLVSRAAYDRAGGHERVKGKVLENVWLARHFRESGTPVRCLVGKGVLTVRMYPEGITSLVEGWTKGFASGAKATSGIIMLFIVAWLCGAVTAPTLFGRLPHWVAITAYAFYAVQIGVFLRRIGSFWLATALLYPIPLLFFFGVFARSVIRSRSTVTWKGRVIRAD